jgi:hypothetical protein
MVEEAIEIVTKMLEKAHTDESGFSATDLYNEGWMLRILLHLQSEGTECLPFDFRPETEWFSEALLYSPFLPRYRGDRLAETHTHLDGVVGHFYFLPDTKRGLALAKDATQFVALEAKMFSRLSKGIKNARYYDQAARTVACIAWTISLSNVSVSNFDSLAFYVIAPEQQIAAGVFSSQVDKSSIRKKIERRIDGYVDEHDKYEELQTWHEDIFIPTLNRIHVDCISWERAVEKTDSKSIRDFYERCLRFNG